MLDISYKLNENLQLMTTTKTTTNSPPPPPPQPSTSSIKNRQYTVPFSSPKLFLENKNLLSQSISLNQKTFFPFLSTNITQQRKPKLTAKLSDKIIKNKKQNEKDGEEEEGDEEVIRRFSIADLAEAALRHQRYQKQLFRSAAVIECCQQQNNQQECPTANFYKCFCEENKLKTNNLPSTFSSPLSRGHSLLRQRRRLFSQYQQKRNCSSSGTHPRPSSRNSGSFFSSTEERCNGDLTQPPSSILVNSSGGVCEGNNNNYLLSTTTELNLPKSLEWSPTIEEEILNKNSNLADPQQQTNLLLLQQKQQQILRRRQSGYGISITTFVFLSFFLFFDIFLKN
ncbi:unnamed protein product [Meloidogyne enterolobii]|uniref:Uncharacterized protein n=1 Tax=Meloidogyne enterolobii TaxID=390850 RepID=A0ACB0Z292_MELEN